MRTKTSTTDAPHTVPIPTYVIHPIHKKLPTQALDIPRPLVQYTCCFIPKVYNAVVCACKNCSATTNKIQYWQHAIVQKNKQTKQNMLSLQPATKEEKNEKNNKTLIMIDQEYGQKSQQPLHQYMYY